MGFIDNIAKVVKRAVGADKGYNKLVKWQEKHERAYSKLNKELFDEREKIYGGTKEVDGDINSTQKPRLKANNVHNVTYEMVESQVDTSMPHPSVKSKRKGFEFAASMIEESLRNDIAELPLHRINDENERVTPVQGLSIVQPFWNDAFHNHLYRGELNMINIHPKQFVPQPGVWDVQDMDYYFIMTSRTKDYIKKRYDQDMDKASENYPEINTVDYETSTQDQGLSLDEKVTEIVCWYKDDDSDVCRIAWAGDILLEDMAKFYHRRIAICQSCGAENAQKAKKCTECGGKKLESKILEKEVLQEDLYLEPIVYEKIVKQVMRDINGDPVAVEDIPRTVIEERFIPAGTEIPYYNPRRYPISIRINTPQSFRFGGQSDVDIIRDQQDAMKKVTSKVERKILSSGSLVTKPRRAKFDLTNEEFQVIEGDIAELDKIRMINLQAEVRQDLEFITHQYNSLKGVLGITDSWQGQYDPSAKSGKAKQIQVQQAAGRLASKILNKQDFFKHLYEIMFEFKLAFYDELRPYITKNSLGEDDWGDFNKYEFLMKDSSGEWYYNTDFVFSADAGYGLPSDKMWLYEQLNAQVGAGLIDLIQYWTMLESLHFPMAAMILSQHKRKQEMMIEQGVPTTDADGEGQSGGEQQPQGGEISNPDEHNPGQLIENILGQLEPGERSQMEQMLMELSPEQQQSMARLNPQAMADYMVELARMRGGG